MRSSIQGRVFYSPDIFSKQCMHSALLAERKKTPQIGCVQPSSHTRKENVVLPNNCITIADDALQPSKSMLRRNFYSTKRVVEMLEGLDFKHLPEGRELA